MEDEKETREQPLDQLGELREAIEELEASRSEPKRTETASFRGGSDFLRAERRVRALSRTAAKVQTLLEPDSIFETIGDELRDLGLHCLFGLLDDGRERVILRHINLSPRVLEAMEALGGVPLSGLRFPVDGSRHFKRVIGEGQAVLEAEPAKAVMDVVPGPMKALGSQVVELLRVRRAISAPLVAGNDILGVLTVWSDDLTERDVPVVSIFAHQAAMGIEIAGLYQEGMHGLFEMEALRKTTLDITRQLEVPELLHSIVERAAALVAAKAGGLYLYHPDEQELELVVSHYLNKDYTGTRLEVGEGLSGKVALTGEPMMVEDYEGWEGRSNKYEGAPFRGVMAVPLKWGEKIIGVVNVTDVDQPRTFTERDLWLVGLFANEAAIAIENAELYQSAQHELAERQRAEEAYRAVVDHSLQGLVILQDHGIAFANQAMADIIGYTVHELLSLSREEVKALVQPEHRADAWGGLEDVLAGEAVPSRFECRVIRKDGGVVWLEVFSSLIEYQGRPAVQAAAVDITERKQAEAELQRSFHALEKTLEGTVNALAALAETRDPYTAGHQERMAHLACAIAEELGLSDDQIRGIRMAGLVHDIGKICVPAEILSKPAALTEVEMEMIQTHPQTAYDILKTVEFPWPVAQIVLQHHERMDGSGYPQGLSGEETILEARILVVADVVEAMASDRPYRPAHGVDEALEEISRNKGSLYDPEVVEACLKLFNEQGYRLE